MDAGGVEEDADILAARIERAKPAGDSHLMMGAAKAAPAPRAEAE